jgi:hypothetical protein
MNTVTGLLAVLAALALSAPALAEVRVGVLGGSSFASLSQHPAEGISFGNHPFFAAGAVADIRLGRRLSLRLAPMFLVKGSDFFIEPDLFLFDRGVGGSFRLSYLELPLLLRLSSREGSIRPYAMAGPGVGYLVKARVRGTNEGESIDEDGKDVFRKGDFGLSFGGGLLVPRGRSSMFVEGRYTLGLINVGKDTEESRLKNRTIQVMAGVTFLLGRR